MLVLLSGLCSSETLILNHHQNEEPMTNSTTSAEQTALATDPTQANVKGHLPSIVAGFGGWLLDAFDFFLVTFCLTAIARDFHKSDAQIALAITMTLAFRPVGGLVFGLIADRYGRRLPLMINIGAFAVAE